METQRKSPLKNKRGHRLKRFDFFLKPLERLTRFILCVMLCYLGQVCIMPYIHPFSNLGISVSPNLIFAGAAVMIVCYDRLHAVWAGCLFGILMESMYTGAVDLYNLLLYPVIISFFTIFFTDKSDVQLEIERSQNKPGRNVSIFIRTPLCALCMISLNEIINIVYVLLRGITLIQSHIARGFASIFLTVALTMVVMLPLRALLGFPLPPRQQKDEKPTEHLV